MPDLYGNPVVSGQMTPHGNEALTQGTQEIDDRYYAEQKYIQSKKAFESLYSVLPVPVEPSGENQVQMKNSNPPSYQSRGFSCFGDTIS